MDNELRNIFINGYNELKILISNYKQKKLHGVVNINFDSENSNTLKNMNQKEKYSICISKVINEVDEEYIISKLLGTVLFLINEPRIEETYATNNFNNLGENIIRTFFFNLYSEKKKINKTSSDYYLTDWMKENEFLSHTLRDEEGTFSEHLGSFLIDWLRECNLVEIGSIKKENKTTSYLRVTKVLQKYIDYEFIPLNIPDRLPMIVEPKKYQRIKINNGEDNREILGGYLLNDQLFTDPIIITNNRLKDNSIISDKNIIYDTINNMSSVGYKINKEVLEFILLNNEKYNLSLVNSKHPLEEKLENNKTRKLTKKEETELESFKSKRFVQENILAIADIYENVDEFFIPVRLDYRGRIYCNTSYLNYQGTELAKSLLLFSKGEKISKINTESINYLKIFGANCYGNKLDKKSANDRINWVNENQEDILDFENGKLLELAESKLLFISFCFEFRNYFYNKNNENNYWVSHLPIQLDATCNGFQHISMLGLDLDLSQKLNIKYSN
jgi:hypothetical protein